MRADGRELLYTAADGRTVLSVEVQPGTPPDFGTPRPRFTIPAGTRETMVATPALDRFLMGLERRQSGRVSLTVLTNWTALLEQAKRVTCKSPKLLVDSGAPSCVSCRDLRY